MAGEVEMYFSLDPSLRDLPSRKRDRTAIYRKPRRGRDEKRETGTEAPHPPGREGFREQLGLEAC